MPVELVAGANAPLYGDLVSVHAVAENGGVIDFAVAVLPVPAGAQPWLPLQDAPPSYAEGATSGVDFTLKMSRFPDAVQTVALVAYASSGATTLKALRSLLIVSGQPMASGLKFHGIRASMSAAGQP